jgi:hypothetical protein
VAGSPEGRFRTTPCLFRQRIEQRGAGHPAGDAELLELVHDFVGQVHGRLRVGGLEHQVRGPEGLAVWDLWISVMGALL